MLLVRHVLAPEHRRRGTADQGDPLPVQHQSETLRGGCTRTITGTDCVHCLNLTLLRDRMMRLREYKLNITREKVGTTSRRL